MRTIPWARTAAHLALVLLGLASAAGAQTGNLLANGRFDEDVSGWTTTFSTYGHLTFHAPPDDDDFCAYSGSADADSDPSVDSGSALFSSCVSPVTGNTDYQLAASMWFKAGGFVDGYANVFPAFYDAPGCTGNPLSLSNVQAGNALSSVSNWQRFQSHFTSPSGAQSVLIRIYLVVDSGADPAMHVLVDDILFAEESYLFADDFEVRQVCRWSAP